MTQMMIHLEKKGVILTFGNMITYTTNHHYMYRQVASILIHRMIILANYFDLPCADDFSLQRIKLEGRTQET
jgi:hypothetical protein